MKKPVNHFLLLGAICSALASLAHLGCIVFGGDWYRFFGAGEQMAQLAEQGHWYPTVVTLVISSIIAIWALYALSGAGVIFKLPLLRLGLCVISGIYVIRGLSFFVLMPYFSNSITFWIVSSSICLFIGLMYSIGTYQTWNK
jgi:hypothetical protein